MHISSAGTYVTGGNFGITAGRLELGSNGTGQCARFYAETSGSYMCWDSTGNGGAGALILTDGASIAFGDAGTSDVTFAYDGTNFQITTPSGTAGCLDIVNAAGDLIIHCCNVGIRTAAPDALLHIAGCDATAYDATAASGQRDEGVTLFVANHCSKADAFSQLVFKNTGSGGTSYARIGAVGDGVESTNMIFVTEKAGTLAEHMRITCVGNVGIGTSAPGRELQIQGNLRLQTATVGENVIIDLSEDSKIKVAMGYSHNDNAFTISHAEAGSMGVGTGQFVIKEGCVGIGTAAPGALLHLEKSSGDPDIQFGIGGTDKYIFGVDDSDSDYLKISVGGTLGANVGEYGFYDGYGFSVVAPEANEARFYLAADNADDAADVWRLVSNTTGGFELGARTSGTSALPANSDTWTERMVIDSSGYVGIGTAAPTERLHVYQSGDGDWVGRFSQACVTGHGLIVQHAGSSASYYGFAVHDGTNFDFVVKTDGKAGIGTTVPSSLLDVSCNTGYNPGFVEVLTLTHDQSGSAAADDNGPVIIFDYNTSSGRYNMGGIKAGMYDGGLESRLYIQAAGTGGALTNIITVDGQNVVGIGTESPAARLHVDGGLCVATGPIRFTSDTCITGNTSISNGYGLIVGHTSQVNIGGVVPEAQVLGTGGADSQLALGMFSTGGGGPQLTFVRSRNGTIGSNTIVQDGDPVVQIAGYADDGTDYVSSVGHIGIAIDGTPGSNDTPGRITFSTTPDGAEAVVERMRIDNAGNVGIGTEAPAEELHVQGTARANVLCSSGAIYTSGAASPIGWGVCEGLMNSGGDKPMLVGPTDIHIIIDVDNNATNNKFTVGKDTSDPGTYTELFRVQENGDVGIGTDAPGYLLDLYQANPELRLNTTSGTNAILTYAEASTTKWQIQYSGGGNCLELTNSTCSCPAIALRDGGGIGFGSSEANVHFNFNVDGRIFTNANARAIDMYGSYKTYTGANQDLIGMNLRTSVCTGGGSDTYCCIFQLGVQEPNITVCASDTVVNSASLYVRNAATEATNNYAIWVESGCSRFDGNVGIGAATPATQLHLVRTATEQTDGLRIQNDQSGGYGSTIAIYSKQNYGSNLSVAAACIYITGTENWGSAGAQSSSIGFAAQVDGTLTEHMMMRGGYVGIGTAVPGKTFEVLSTTAADFAAAIRHTAADGNGLLITAGVDSGDYALRVMNCAGATDLLSVRGSGNVGIGTGTPTCTLEVWMCCAAHCSNLILTNDCSTGHQSAIEFCNGYGSGFSNARIAGGVEDTGDGYIRFQVGLASTLTNVGYWDSDGNLAIGSDSPDAKLEIVGSDAGKIFTMQRAGGGAASRSFGLYIGGAADCTLIFTAADDCTTSAAFCCPILALEATSANVGIGTTAPAYALDVWGNVRLAKGLNQGVIIDGTRDSDYFGSSYLDIHHGPGGYKASINFKCSAATDVTSGFICFTNDGSALIISNCMAGYMSFETSATERLRILSDGCVGIGTAAPNAHLHISRAGDAVYPAIHLEKTSLMNHYIGYDTEENLVITENVDMVSSVRFGMSTGGDVAIGRKEPTIAANASPVFSIEGTNPAFSMIDSDNAIDYIMVSLASGSANWYYDDAAATTWSTATASTGAGAVERMRLDSSGGLGIGTTAPATPLHVIGKILMGTNTTDAASGYNSVTYPLTVTYTGTSHQGASWYDKTTDSSQRIAIYFRRYYSSSWQEAGRIDTTENSAIFSTSSDYRLKENETQITGALSSLNQLQPYEFNFKSDYGNVNTIRQGFFAHEAAEIVPQAVTGEKDAVDDDGEIMVQGIDHSHMVPLLVAAVQELSDKVDALSA